MKPLAFDRNYGKWFANDMQRAIKKYRMILEGETIRVALSGGKDSMTLLYALAWLRRFSHFVFELEALHVRTAGYDTAIIRECCEDLDIPYREANLVQEPDPGTENPCYLCARLKRGAIADLLREQGRCTIAYGHHADDAVETLFMNMIENRKLGSFSPRVTVNNSTVTIIRPMIYLAEETIARLHAHAELPLLEYRCPYEDSGLRREFKQHVIGLKDYFGVRDFSRRVVAAIENIDKTNIWPDLFDPASE